MLRETRICHDWSLEMVETLTKMWRNGNSKKEIAAALGKGLTPNAIGGKANRLNLGPHPTVKDQTRSFHQVAHVARTVKSSVPAHQQPGVVGKPSMPALPVSRFTY